MKVLNKAMEGYIKIKLEKCHDIPLPFTEKEYSGKFVVRLPKSLHQRLALEAEKESTPLNQYALYQLEK